MQFNGRVMEIERWLIQSWYCIKLKVQCNSVRCKCPDALYPQLERFREFNSAELGVRKLVLLIRATLGNFKSLSRWSEGRIAGEKGVTEKDGPIWKKEKKMNFVFRIVEMSYSLFWRQVLAMIFKIERTRRLILYTMQLYCLVLFLSLTKIF